MRVQLGASWRPAPTSANSAERSSTRTLTPLRVSANAAERPPMPPPTMMTSGRAGAAAESRVTARPPGRRGRSRASLRARFGAGAVELERLEDRGVAEPKQVERAGVRVGDAGLRPGRERLPGGHHAQVAAADRPGRVADGDGAGAVEDGVDRGAGLAGRSGSRVARDPVHFHPD